MDPKKNYFHRNMAVKGIIFGKAVNQWDKNNFLIYFSSFLLPHFRLFTSITHLPTQYIVQMYSLPQICWFVKYIYWKDLKKACFTYFPSSPLALQNLFSVFWKNLARGGSDSKIYSQANLVRSTAGVINLTMESEVH